MTDWRNLKRFYKEASAIKTDDGFTVALDGKPVKTPGKRDLVVPLEVIAEAIVAEWQEQGETIDVPAMAMLRLAATAIDRVAVNRAEVDAVTLKFAETDLLCYRGRSRRSSLRDKQNPGSRCLIGQARTCKRHLS